MMSIEESHHQRRRRKWNAVLVFKVLTAIGQAAFLVVRILYWFFHRE